MVSEVVVVVVVVVCGIQKIGPGVDSSILGLQDGPGMSKIDCGLQTVVVEQVGLMPQLA